MVLRHFSVAETLVHYCRISGEKLIKRPRKSQQLLPAALIKVPADRKDFSWQPHIDALFEVEI